MKKIGLFAAGVLFGTAGMKLLGSKDAKRAALPQQHHVGKTLQEQPHHRCRPAGKGQRDDRCDRCA